jgi:hypothetical protein
MIVLGDLQQLLDILMNFYINTIYVLTSNKQNIVFEAQSHVELFL